jgi:ferrochelatase
MTPPTGVLVMAYGTADGPDDIERYYTDIRGGRPPTPEHLAELRERYEATGNRFPLMDITREQAAGLEAALNQNQKEPDAFRAYLGMKHSSPFIAEAVAQMRDDGTARAVGIVMAPHWSGMSVETYVQRVLDASPDGTPSFTFVRSFHDHPLFIEMLASRVREAFGELRPSAREAVTLIVSAHSLPVRTLEDGTQRCRHCTACEKSCRYRDGLQETADLVAKQVGADAYTIAWQSAGRTADPWWGPPIEDVIREQAQAGRTGVVVCSAGFVADHLEILYDLDIEAASIAQEAGLGFARTRMPNADADFVAVLDAVVREHLASEDVG